MFKDYLDFIGPKSIKNCLKKNKSILEEKKKEIQIVEGKIRKHENER